MPSLAELPIEILQENLIPFLDARGLLHLTCTSKFFSVVCSDDAVWKQKLVADFNFTGAGTARTTGWKVIYRGLHKPKVYVWGERANGRLGAVNLPKSSAPGFPFPFQLKVPNARIVRLIAGGTSFHALDSDGNIHVWGTLCGEAFAPDRPGFSDPSKKAPTPHKLQMPSRIRSISCGRFHASALDSQNKVWTFVNWGRPFSIESPVLRDPGSPVIQVECGWGFTSVLTAHGDVFVWWPFSRPLKQILEEKNDPNKRVDATADKVIPCEPIAIDSFDLTRLPALPPLPPLSKTGGEDGIPQLIQIAGLEGYLIGLTNHGHVLKFGKLDGLGDDDPQPQPASRGRWDYLPQFSNIDLIRQNKVFNENDGKASVPAPDVMKITHITASFRHFSAYSTGSSSLVLIGTNDTTPDSEPEIKAELQNRSVISVAVGDWHNAALTSDGKVLTWGEFSAGALGLGDPGKLEPGTPGGYAPSSDGRRRRTPPTVDVPTQVRFDHGVKEPRDRFAFAITAAGWHTGALVMDLDPNGDEEDVYEMEEDDQPVHPSNVPLDPHTYETPPILPPLGPFRVGILPRHGLGGIRGRGRGG